MKILSAADILILLRDAGVPVNSCVFLDSQYVVPTEDWIRGQFSTDLRARFFAMGMAYDAEREDCDDFAIEAWAQARRSHGRHSRVRAGAAFALFDYWRSDDNHHMASCYISEKGVGFYEPQLLSVVNLTEAERRSCEHAIW